MGNADQLYKELVQIINQTVGRQAVTEQTLRQLMEEAREVKNTRGTMGLLQFSKSVSERLFTPAEREKLENSPYRKEYGSRIIDLMVAERIVTPIQGMWMKQSL
ncbi:hypothetical protein [Mechercharimyces sp. CAU 1602]|uniref:hypothetical protein n=1 Tax=Mechercharimyces sp. CAU 1602 TaxID=2973933 RepID=UPI0021615159|nr:hypothetical protein [Mechercharimyces sp. CAU 1602]MCS1351376.1 hypothetical protein [Mechercharimyces sp. CAU 1602]